MMSHIFQPPRVHTFDPHLRIICLMLNYIRPPVLNVNFGLVNVHTFEPDISLVKIISLIFNYVIPRITFRILKMFHLVDNLF